MFQVALHLLVLGCGLVVATSSLVWLSRNSDKIAATEFGLFFAVLMLWAIVQIVEVLGGAPTAYYASFLIRGLHGLMVFSWFYFTMTYAGYGDLVRSTTVRTVVVVGTIYLVLMTSVPPIATEFIFPSVTTVTDPFVAVDLGGTTPFRRTTQAVGYSLFAVGTVGLTYRFVTTGYTRLWRPVTVSGTALSIAALDLVVEKGAPFHPGIDYAAVGTPVAAGVLILVLYRYDLFGSVPVGRDHLFRTLTDPVFVVDAEYRIVDRNEAATTLCRPDCGIGDEVDSALPGQQDIAQMVEAESDGPSTLQVDRQGGTKYYELTTSDVRPADASQTSVLILSDVTELLHQRRRLEQQNERLEDFASVVSHDLRNPLNIIDLRLELAREESDNEHLDAIARASDRMDALITDLLKLARHGEAVDDTEPVDVAALTELSWRNVATTNATLTTDITRTIDADPARLRQLLENLIRNSVEHGSTGSRSSPHGNSVEHSATGSRTESDDAIEHGDKTVTVSVGELDTGFYVADNGPGIPADEREDVFEAGHSTTTDGTGLGLSIVKQVVDAHGWQIRVTDSTDGGARFEITGVDVVSE